MIINSDFRDYYDSVSSHGVDKTVVYNRFEKSLFVKHDDIRSIFGEFSERQYWTSPLIDIIDRWCDVYIFCGKLILVFKHEHLSNIGWLYFSDFEKLKESEFYQRKIADRGYSWAMTGSRLESLLYRFSAILNKDVSQYAVSNNIVVARLVYCRDTASRDEMKWQWDLNPKLSDREFQKVIDPYTAHQDIMNWISGVVGSPAGEMIEINDKDKVVSKGFDPKYGFRTRPHE